MQPTDIESVIEVLPGGALPLLLKIAMFVHFFAAIMIISNPLNQQIEELLLVPTSKFKFIQNKLTKESFEYKLQHFIFNVISDIQ